MYMKMCKRCNTPWWETGPRKPQTHPMGKWANGAPAWMKNQSEGKDTLEVSAQVKNIQQTLDILGEEENEVTRALREKMNALKLESPEILDQDKKKELEALKKEHKHLQTALSSMEDVTCCEHIVENMKARLAAIDATIKEKNKKPAQERVRSLQDKKQHRETAIKTTSSEIEAAKKRLEELEEKERDQQKEMKQIQAELEEATRELAGLQLDQKPQSEKTEQRGEEEVMEPPPTKRGRVETQDPPTDSPMGGEGGVTKEGMSEASKGRISPDAVVDAPMEAMSEESTKEECVFAAAKRKPKSRSTPFGK